MKIAAIEDLHCDAGWRNFSFLKITTDDGLIGYSEYNESYGAKGLTAAIHVLGDGLIGVDPRPIEAITARLFAMTRMASGGVMGQAIAAIENALLDIKAKALGIPVYELLGGPIRDRFRLYWSHCGSYRLHHHQTLGVDRVDSLDGMVGLGREVAAKGYTALKSNIYLFDGAEPVLHMPGFAAPVPGAPEVNWDRRLLGALADQVAALREGAGPDVDILIDLNFNFRTEGFLQVARTLDSFGLMWLELDLYEPDALHFIRRSVGTPIASLESQYGRRGYRPFLESRAVDVAIVDVPWNGLLESVKIAAMADAFEVNVAPHNFYGHLSTLMSAHFCAAIPNFRIMEIDPDDVPWKDDLVSAVPQVEDGHLVLPTAPGWGADVNEDAVRAHPPK